MRNYRVHSGLRQRLGLAARLTPPAARGRLASRLEVSNVFGTIGGPELILILVLALLLFGPRKLPQIGRSLGRALAEFRGATNELRSTLEREVELDELRQTQQELSSTGREIQVVARSDGASSDEP